ncbi:MAG TPA: Ig-like domain-containing protein [Gemmatimonadaceae bacterium]|nr:Ig-like domain-containing protein [Gemmatimonadaceae bacterium]
MDSTDPPPLAGDTTPVVSDPVSGGSSATTAASFTSGHSVVAPLQASGSADVAYVSLRPGTVPGGERATLQRRGSTITVTATIDGGGLDPVPVEAAPGDSVDVTVQVAGGAFRRFTLRVPEKRRPRIVRTHPPPKKKDVALNAGIVIVFTEPVDGGTVSSPSIRLLKDGTMPVPGTAHALAGATAAVVFQPQSQLDPRTIYRLVVTEAVKDLDGDALEVQDTVEFETGTDYERTASRVTVLPDTTVLRVGSRVQLSAITMAGDDTMRTRIFGVPIAWFSDNAAVASVTSAGLVTAIDAGEARIRAVVLNQEQVFGSAIVIASGTLASVERVELAPAPPIAPLTGRVELTAVARDSAGNALPFRQVSWSTSDSTIATVEPMSGGRAWITAAGLGTATITATIEGKSAAAGIGVVRPGAYARLSAGGGGSQTYTCGLTTDSWALCWGNNHAGQLGNTLALTVITPTAVARGLQFSSVSTGSATTCALTSSGAAHCWGDNTVGTLGIGSTAGPEQCIYGSCSMSPVAVTGGLTFSSIAVGGNRFACALTPNGNAYCWGSNENGRLGIGVATGPESCNPFAQEPGAPCSSMPVLVTGGLTFSTLTSGGSHSCALTPGGVAYCWGSNLGGQLGDGTTIDRYSPTRVAGGLEFASISAGSSHTCALTLVGEAYCWGENGESQLGLGSTTGPELCPDQFGGRTCSTAPAAVAGGTRWETVVAGGYHTCALTTAGAAYCWGYNGGTLGDGTTIARSTPTQVAGGLTFANLTASGSHTCGVTLSNIAYCWGNNQTGSLGSGTTGQDPVATPVRVVGQP